jgi:hypothetical protein
MRCLLFAIACLASLTAFTPAGDTEKPAPFKITTEFNPAARHAEILSKLKDGNGVTAGIEKGQTVIDIRSDIDRAVIERTGKRWTDTVVIRLHLNGLEHFEASAGKVRASVEVSSTGLGILQDAKVNQPLHLRVRALDRAGKEVKPGVLEKGGHYEVTLPYALLKDNPKSLALGWIDFYRR